MKKAKRITIHVAICFFVTLLIFFSHSKRSEAGTCNAEPTDMSVSYGQSITCDINSGSDTDTYRFSGKAKDRVIIEADWVSGDNFVPDIELIAPDGSRVTSTYYPYVIETNLSQTGTYTVIVSAHDTRYIGKYNFMVSCTGGTCLPSSPPPVDLGCNISCSSEPTDMFLNYGTRVLCDIGVPSDVDIYRFTGRAKDRVIIEADWVSGDNFVPDIELIAPDGSRVTSTYYPYVIETNLSQTGTYTVIVSAHDTRYIGKYNLTIKCAGGSCLPTGNTPCSGPTLSSDMKMHIPVLNILTQSGWVPIWADFEYLPDQNGNILFKTVNYGLIK